MGQGESKINYENITQYPQKINGLGAITENRIIWITLEMVHQAIPSMPTCTGFPIFSRTVGCLTSF